MLRAIFGLCFLFALHFSLSFIRNNNAELLLFFPRACQAIRCISLPAFLITYGLEINYGCFPFTTYTTRSAVVGFIQVRHSRTQVQIFLLVKNYAENLLTVSKHIAFDREIE